MAPMRGMAGLGVGLMSLAGGIFPTCGGEPQRRALPEGTVLVLAGAPLTASEIDAVAVRLGSLSPNFTLPHLRRLALTNVLFPLVTARALAGPERELASEEARRFLEEWMEGRAQGPLQVDEGSSKTLGLEAWLQLAELEPGEWSPVFEDPGAFVVARLVERDHAPLASLELFRATIVRFPYNEARAEIDQMVFEQQLVFLDPAWERIVPGTWKARMVRKR